jgi:hypothetical protein
VNRPTPPKSVTKQREAESPLQYVKGTGPKRAAAVEAFAVYYSPDLLFNLSTTVSGTLAPATFLSLILCNTFGQMIANLVSASKKCVTVGQIENDGL